MAETFNGRKRIRKKFGSIEEVAEMPNLIEVQKSSYDDFLMVKEPPGGRSDDHGLQAVFKSVFPISDFSGRATLEFVRYEFEPPKYDVDECMQRDMTYSAPLKVKLRLIVFDVNEETGSKSIKDVKEQDVYMGDMPLMTMNGTFVINGTERVIVSQMHRSPGVFFDHDRGRTHASGKLLFAARIIPYRGSWLDFEFDAKDIVYVRIDRRRKLPVTTLLYALGLNDEEILATFYKHITIKESKRGWKMPFVAEKMRGMTPQADLADAKTGEVVIKAGEKITARKARELAEGGLKEVLVSSDDLAGTLHRRGHRRPGDRHHPRRGRRRARRGAVGRAQGPEGEGVPDPRHRPRQYRALHPQHIEHRQERQSARGADGHLPGHAARRAADDRGGDEPVQRAVLRFRALRSLRRRPREDEHAPRARRARHHARPAQGGHPRRHQDARRSARRQGRHRRHRPSRQPARALGRRADGEPVSRRPTAHGARHQGAHELGRHRYGDAAGPDQRQAGGRRRARVLRLLAAVAVHGPDQPALRDHPQAAPLGAGSRAA